MGNSPGSDQLRAALLDTATSIVFFLRQRFLATEPFPSQFLAGRMGFDGNSDRMKSLCFRKQTKSLAYLVGGKCMDTRAIVTDPKNHGPIKVEDTIAALQYSRANKLAFTQKSERSIDRRA